MKYTGDFYADHDVLILDVLASAITQDENYIDALVAKTLRIYKNPFHGRKMADTTKGRNYVYMFMNHWFNGEWYPGQIIEQSKLDKLRSDLLAEVSK